MSRPARVLYCVVATVVFALVTRLLLTRWLPTSFLVDGLEVSLLTLVWRPAVGSLRPGKWLFGVPLAGLLVVAGEYGWATCFETAERNRAIARAVSPLLPWLGIVVVPWAIWWVFWDKHQRQTAGSTRRR